MALTLTESSKYTQDTLRRGVIEEFVLQSVILDRLPLMNVQGNAYAYNVEAQLPGVAWRAVNEAYPESTGVINQQSERLFILGGDADVDRFQVQTQGNLNDLRAIQTAMKVKALVYEFQDAFINGDSEVNAKQFDGLAKRLTGSQVIDADGLPVIGSGESDQHAFLDALDALVAAVPGRPSALYMNDKLLGKIKSSARRLGFLENTTDGFGKKVSTYDGIPMLPIGANPDGTEIVPNDEAADDGLAYTDATSIYAVRFGEGESDHAVTGLTNGGVMVDDLGELQEKPSFRTRIEFYAGIGIFGGGGAARLTRVRAA